MKFVFASLPLSLLQTVLSVPYCLLVRADTTGVIAVVWSEGYKTACLEDKLNKRQQQAAVKFK